jgi:hypothetical protein
VLRGEDCASAGILLAILDARFVGVGGPPVADGIALTDPWLNLRAVVIGIVAASPPDVPPVLRLSLRI